MHNDPLEERIEKLLEVYELEVLLQMMGLTPEMLIYCLVTDCGATLPDIEEPL